MYVCDTCGKRTVTSKSGAHRYGGGWEMRAPKKSRIWKPNLHTYRVGENGRSKLMLLCTKCLRLVKRPVMPKITKAALPAVTV